MSTSTEPDDSRSGPARTWSIFAETEGGGADLDNSGGQAGAVLGRVIEGAG